MSDIQILDVLENYINANHAEACRYDKYINEIINNNEYDTKHDTLQYYRSRRMVFNNREQVLTMAYNEICELIEQELTEQSVELEQDENGNFIINCEVEYE